MLRAIEGYHRDAVGDWVAELRCGHDQHVRHAPPFWRRPWVLSAEGRRAYLGVELTCPLCDRFELPAGLVSVARTPELDEVSAPSSRVAGQATPPGTWGLIHVTAGRLRYIVEPPLAGERILEPGSPGVVVPEVAHRLVPEGRARFFVELFARPARPPPG